METDEQARNRFQSELEFVQCLANPNYLNFLAQRGYLRERPFINYLKYLLYWKEPEYAKFLKYPHCLHMLELLQYEHFRKELVNAQCAKFIDEQQLLHWQHYSRKRTRLQQALAEQQQAQQRQAPPGAPAHWRWGEVVWTIAPLTLECGGWYHM
uniref:Mediator of RNA polymerase II transcription subunit 31 n=1 Tax=Monopterus albus TaxID=43700 RepID=A0A3Q3KE45_MONAL|nr:mediator of RNA polymerase II transcription subunit 31 [Monopterus albus]